jgi:hypothetical protein
MSRLLELNSYVVQLPWINLADELGLSRGQFNTNFIGRPRRVFEQPCPEVALEQGCADQPVDFCLTCHEISLLLLPKDAWMLIPTSHLLYLLRDLIHFLGIESPDACDLPRAYLDSEAARCLLRIFK